MNIRIKLNSLKFSITNHICHVLLRTIQKDERQSFIAMFHDVVSQSENAQDNYTCTEKEYVQFIEKIKQLGFDIVSLDSLLECPHKYQMKKKVVISFDDGFSSTYSFVNRYMTSKGLPYIVYVNTSLLNTPGYINSKQLKEMASNPFCTIGMHAHEHIPYLSVPDEKLRLDYKICDKIITEITGKRPEHYAFPYGSVNSCSFRNCNVIQHLGVKSIAMTLPIKITLTSLRRPFYLPRINIPSYFRGGQIND